MPAQIIDGKAFAATVREKVAVHVSRLKNDHGITPGLAVVLVGEDPASQVYVRNKIWRTEAASMTSIEHRLPANTTRETLLALVDQLNRDDGVDGILVQLPLPEHLDATEIVEAIDPAKDVDGLTAKSAGALVQGANGLRPCTPSGCV